MSTMANTQATRHGTIRVRVFFLIFLWYNGGGGKGFSPLPSGLTCPSGSFVSSRSPSPDTLGTEGHLPPGPFPDLLSDARITHTIVGVKGFPKLPQTFFRAQSAQSVVG